MGGLRGAGATTVVGSGGGGVSKHGCHGGREGEGGRGSIATGEGGVEALEGWGATGGCFQCLPLRRAG